MVASGRLGGIPFRRKRTDLLRCTPHNLGTLMDDHSAVDSSHAASAAKLNRSETGPGAAGRVSTNRSVCKLPSARDARSPALLVQDRALRSAAGVSDDLEVAHHAHVFVFEVVAVQDVSPAVGAEAGDHGGLFGWAKVEDVFFAGVVAAGAAGVASQDLKVDEVKVDGVMEVAGEAPDFDVVETR